MLAAATALVGGSTAYADVSPSGALVTNVAIEIPRFHGLEPTLQLAYDSQLGNGLLGVGWKLDGFSSIRRAAPGLGAPRYDKADEYFLDGVKLVPCARKVRSPSCSHPASKKLLGYATGVESYRRIAYDERSEKWIVWEKDGTQATYAPDVRKLPHGPVAQWHVAMVRDATGNEVAFGYRAENGVVYPASVSYDGMTVRLIWENRPDVVEAGIGDRQSELRFRLKTIDVLVRGSRARAYALRYRRLAGSGRSALVEVQRYGTDATFSPDDALAAGHRLPPTRFRYDEQGKLAFEGNEELSPMTAPGWEAPAPRNSFPDVEQNLGTRPFGKAVHTADVDGDGRTDALLVTFSDLTTDQATVRATTRFADGNNVTTSLVFPVQVAARSWAADIDADGRSDLVFLWWERSPTDQLIIHLVGAVGLGDGTFRLGPTLHATTWIDHTAPAWQALCQPGDVTGDGRADFVCSYSDGDGNHFLGTAFSRGDGTFSSIKRLVPVDSGVGTLPLALGDVDGDGLDDAQLLDLLPPVGGCPASDTCEFDYEPVTGFSIGGGDYRFVRVPARWHTGEFLPTLFSADLNGDGRADYLSFAGAVFDENDRFLGRIRTAVTNASGGFDLGEQSVPAELANVENVVSLGDADGDGRTDMLVMTPLRPNGGVDCGSSTHIRPSLTTVRSLGDGTFDLPARWDDCNHSQALDGTWDNVLAPPEVIAADTNGDGLADFMTRFFVEDNSGTSVTIHDEISQSTGRDAFRWLPAELNGDGREDLVYISPQRGATRLHSLLRRPNGSYLQASVPVAGFSNPSRQTWRILDVDGDGREDLVHIECFQALITPRPCITRVDTFLANGAGGWTRHGPFSFVWTVVDHTSPSDWHSADVDGDGRTDLVALEWSRGDYHPEGLYVRTLLANGVGGWRQAPLRGPFAPPPATYSFDTRNWGTLDVDGDGRTDLVHLVTSRASIRVTTLLARGDADWQQRRFERTEAGGNGWQDLDIVSDTTIWRSIDANGDGLGDLVHLAVTANGLRTHTLLSDGDGTYTQRQADEHLAVDRTSDRLSWTVANSNADGHGDLMHTRRKGDRIVVTVLQAIGKGEWRVRQSSTRDPGSAGNRDMPSWRVADADGDGISDLVRVDRPLPGQPGAPSLRVSTLDGNGVVELLTGLTSELGGMTDVAYAPSSRSVESQPAHGCGVPAGVVFQIAASETVRDGRTQLTDVTQYAYGCARWSRAYRSVLGWTDLSVRRPGTADRAESRAYRRYLQTEECGTQLQDDGFRDLSGRFVAGRDLFTYVRPGKGAPYACLPAERRHIEYGGTPTPLNSVTRYVYDDFGNLVDVFDDGSPDDTADDRTLIRTFHPALKAWIVGSPAWEGLFEGPQPARTMRRSTFYCYDGDNGNASANCPGAPTKGLLTGVQAVDDLGLYVTSTRGHDAAGNVAATMGPRHFGAAAFYDPTFHLYPESVCNALSQCLTVRWNTTLGAIESVKDANQAETSFHYDELGRTKRIEYPGGKVVEEQYLDWGDPTRQHVRERIDDGTADGLWSETYLDGLGRVYRVVKEGDAAGKTFSQLTQYADASTAPHRTSQWFRSRVTKRAYETYEYDGAGRLSRQTHPDGTYLAFGYGSTADVAWTSVTDERKHTHTTYVDAHGRVTRVRDTAPGVDASTRMTYDAADHPLTLSDPNGNVTTWTWDVLGQLRTVEDPDLGRRTYTYDLGGNLETSTDAKGSTIRFTYDALDRRKTKSYPNGSQVVWTYDEPGHGAGIGRLTSVTDPSAAGCPQTQADSFNYDAAGHVDGWDKCIAGRAESFGFVYDPPGRLKRVTYPDSEAVEYTYDPAGRLSAVPGYVTRFLHDPSGRKTQIDFANGVVERLRYNAPRQWLEGLTLVRGGQSLLDVTYSHFANGLVRSATSPTSGSVTYAYDGLDRLTGVTGPTPETFHYDDAGNTLSSSSVGTYTYPVQGANACLGSWPRACGPHAAGQAGSVTLHYDANGDLSSATDASTGESKGIDWTYDHQPEFVSDFDGTLTRYAYDWNGNRVTRERGTSSTRYYGQLLDVPSTTTGPTKHYWADGLLIASRSSTGVTWYQSDLRGSTRFLTDGTGTVTASQDYTAFGAPTGTPVEHGFTGRRFDADNGLLHVGARDYDPKLGRFISPDTTVSDDGGTQASNRYAYVDNDPVGNIDADGHQASTAALDRAVAADVRSVVSPEEISRFRQNPFTLEGLSAMLRGLKLYAHPDTTPPDMRTSRIIRNMSLTAGYYVGLGQKTTKGLADDNLTLATVQEEGLQNLLAVAGFALRGVLLYRETIAESAGFRSWAAAAPNASALKEVGEVAEGQETVSIFHASINDATAIAEGGLDAERTPTWATRDIRAAQDALGPNRIDPMRDPGIIESRVPKSVFERVLQPSERPYSGFNSALPGSSEIVLRTPEQVGVFNQYRVQGVLGVLGE